jgi:amino acid efflux transporter
VDLRTLVLLITGSFVLVYALGAAAAVRLLPRRSWAYRGAWLAVAAVVLLLAATGVYLLWTVVVALAALAYVRRGRATRYGPPGTVSPRRQA